MGGQWEAAPTICVARPGPVAGCALLMSLKPAHPSKISSCVAPAAPACSNEAAEAPNSLLPAAVSLYACLSHMVLILDGAECSNCPHLHLPTSPAQRAVPQGRVLPFQTPILHCHLLYVTKRHWPQCLLKRLSSTAQAHQRTTSRLGTVCLPECALVWLRGRTRARNCRTADTPLWPVVVSGQWRAALAAPAEAPSSCWACCSRACRCSSCCKPTQARH